MGAFRGVRQGELGEFFIAVAPRLKQLDIDEAYCRLGSLRVSASWVGRHGRKVSEQEEVMD